MPFMRSHARNFPPLLLLVNLEQRRKRCWIFSATPLINQTPSNMRSMKDVPQQHADNLLITQVEDDALAVLVLVGRG